MSRPPISRRVVRLGERWRQRMLLRLEQRKLERKAKRAGELGKLKRRQEAELPVRNVKPATPAPAGPAAASQERANPKPLIAAYQARGSQFPDWAYRRPDGTVPPPPVPFMGRRYGKWGGILVYASAENLAGYENNPERIPAYFKDDRAWNRGRVSFAAEFGSRFFPAAHIAPFGDGSLFVAINYYLLRVHGEEASDPDDLLESIAAANFCKFSAAGDVNKDYAGKWRMIIPSIPYVREDLQHLRPRVIFLPKTIWRLPKLRLPEMIEELAPGASVCPLYQFNPGVVHRHLADRKERAECLRHKLVGTRLDAWISQMRGYSLHSPYRYLIHMDEELSWLPYERSA